LGHKRGKTTPVAEDDEVRRGGALDSDKYGRCQGFVVVALRISGEGGALWSSTERRWRDGVSGDGGVGARGRGGAKRRKAAAVDGME
jgi:hypothetical protein